MKWLATDLFLSSWLTALLCMFILMAAVVGTQGRMTSWRDNSAKYEAREAEARAREAEARAAEAQAQTISLSTIV